MRRLSSILILIAVGSGLIAGPARVNAAPAQASSVLLVAAASDLRFALEELSAAFQAQTHVPVGLTFGSSGQLASQIEQGAPFDVFFSANEAFVQELARKGLVVRESVKLYAIGRIVLWVRADFAINVGDGLGVLVDDRIRFVAIANPQHAPYGQAAVEALQTLGSRYAQVKQKLVLGENISQTLQLVQTGNADVGVVAFSLAVAPAVRSTGRYWLIPSYLHRPIRQAVGVVSQSPRRETGAAFAAFVNGPAGRPIMRRYGFALPGEGL